MATPKKKTPGRPKMEESEKVQRTSTTHSPANALILKRLGAGSLSAGVRKACAIYCENYGK